jgi:hypothetical protein
MGLWYLEARTMGLAARDLTSNDISTEKMSVSVKLLVLKYCIKKIFKENLLPKSVALYFNSTK